MAARRVTAVAGDVSTDGLGLDDAGRAIAGQLRHRHPLGRHGVVRLARSTAPSRSTCSARPASPPPCTTSASRPTSSPCRPATSPATAAGSAPEIMVTDDPFSVDIDWRREVEGARRARSDAEAESRTPEKLDEFRAEARPSSAPPAPRLLSAKTEQLRSRWVSDRLVEAGIARATSLGWPDAYAYTKALGERALLETHGDVPDQHRAPVDHRVGPGRAPAGLDPRLPHGRAGDHLLRPRPAEGVPRRARGHRRRHPGRPRRRRHHRRRRRRARHRSRHRRRRARGRAGRLGLGRTRCATAAWSTSSARWFKEHPLYDNDGQPIVVPEWSLPRPRPGAGPARAGQDLARAGREGAGSAAAARQAGPAQRHRRGAPRGGRAGPRLRRALRRLRRVRGGLRRRPAARPVGPPDPRRPGRVQLRPPGRSTGTATSPRSTCRRSSSTAGSRARPAPAPARPATSGCGARCCHPTASSPPSTSRTRSSRRTWWPPTRGWPPAASARDERLRFVAQTLAEAPVAAGPRPQGPQRLPAPLLPPLRRRPGRADRARTRPRCSAS